MVGPEAEHEGIIRAGARFVEAMATARVPKLVLTVNHASGAGYYAMAGQGFDPDFIFSWPTGSMGVMEGESAIQAVHGPAIEDAQESAASRSPRTSPRLWKRCARTTSISSTLVMQPRVDSSMRIVAPEETRDVARDGAHRRAAEHADRTSGRSCCPAQLDDA